MSDKTASIKIVMTAKAGNTSTSATQVKGSLSLGLLAVILIISPGLLLAQDYAHHPYLSDTFSFSLGAMRSSNSFKLEADLGDDIGDAINFAGIHNLKMKAFIEGEIKIDDETSNFQEGNVDVSQPLPNIGAWYGFSPAKKWLLHGRVDWIGASIGDYDGHMWNFNVPSPCNF
jgi:hypothetical protein